MRLFFITLCFLGTGIRSFGQNTFPSSGNVGVGTLSPNALVDVKYKDVNTNLYRATDQNGQYRWRIDQTYNMLLTNSSGTDILNIGQNGAWFNSGNVGIGTSSPSAKLNVYSAGAATQMILGNPSTGSGGYTALLSGTSADSNGFGYLQTIQSSGSSLGSLVLNKDGGNVGIGMSSPLYKLDVNGNSRIGMSLDIGGPRNANSDPGGLSIYDYTQGPGSNFQLAQSAWGQSHAILFNSYKASPQLNGDFSVNGNIKYSNDAGPYGSGAAMIHFLGNGGRMDFYVSPVSSGQNTAINWSPILSLVRNGNVGIGSMSPDAKLTVKGQVHAQEVKVDLNVPGPDYVFEKDYALPSLDQIKNYIEENKHLPEVPSAKEMEKNGVQLGEMNMLLLKKIEELTLYVIELEKKVNNLENKVTKQ
jgi:hypothetical protein